MITKRQFLDAYRADLVQHYEWAQNTATLDTFMLAVKRTIGSRFANMWDHNSDAAKRVWRQVMGRAHYSLVALRNLPD